MRARAFGRIAKLAADARRYPDLARRDLEYVYRVTGTGSRSDIESAIGSASNPYVRKTLREALTLFHPGEDAPLPPPVQVSERLSKFLALPLERQFAVYDELSKITTTKDKAGNKSLVTMLHEAGLDSVEALNALREAARRQWISDSHADAKARPDMEAKAVDDVRMRPLDLGPEGEDAVVRPVSEIAAEEVQAVFDRRAESHPMSLLEDGIEAATSRFKDYFDATRLESYKNNLRALRPDLPDEYFKDLSIEAARRDYEASLPTPERMALLLNRFPDLRKLDTGSDKWIDASVPKVNAMVSRFRDASSIERGDPRWSQADADLRRMEANGFTVDFFQSLVPGVDLFNTKAKAYEITANDLRNAYDPEGALRESIAAQKEGLPVCPS